MSLLETVSALLAVVFFTSIALIYNNSAFRQKQHLYHANAYVQATITAHEVLDEIDARLFSKDLTFEDIETEYNTTRTASLAHNGETFIMSVTAVDADSTGVPLATPLAGNIFTRVSVVVAPNAGLRHSVTMSRVFTKTHLNL